MTFSRSKAIAALVVVLRLVLGGIFIYAGYLKLRDPWQLFAASIASYELVPMWMAEIVAKVLPWFEVAAGAGLLIGWRLLPAASIATALLLLVFNALIWKAFLQGKEIDCGCFGPGEALTWKTLVRDGSMLAGALLVVWWAVIGRRKVGPAAASLQSLDSTDLPARLR
jgi:uncharacterized membrane protein YphA (DoxX/SURF4 family)